MNKDKVLTDEEIFAMSDEDLVRHCNDVIPMKQLDEAGENEYRDFVRLLHLARQFANVHYGDHDVLGRTGSDRRSIYITPYS